jgi:hypothetical protein
MLASASGVVVLRRRAFRGRAADVVQDLEVVADRGLGQVECLVEVCAALTPKSGEMLEDGAEAYGADMQEEFAASRRVVLHAHRAVTGPVVLPAFRAAVARRGVV